jgi:hypothetical protein
MSGVVNFETLVSDIQRAPVAACGRVDPAALRAVWAALARGVAHGLRGGRGTKVLNFGTFGIGSEVRRRGGLGSCWIDGWLGYR